MSSITDEPVPLVELEYVSDLKVTIVRHMSNILLISSDIACFKLQINFENNVDRDVVTLLLR